MLRYHITSLVPYDKIIQAAEKQCPQIIRERCSPNRDVMEKRLNAYLLLGILCGGSLPEMRWSERGKPLFADDKRYCSLSHTDAGVAAVIADREVGIDLQTLIPFTMMRCQRVCRDAERVYCEWADSPDEKNLRFTRIWSAKEAIVKALGTGIGVLSFRDIKVDIMHGVGKAEGVLFTLQFPEDCPAGTVCCIAIRQD